MADTKNTAVQLVERKKKRVGRGHGSGKVKTGGRGTKGQNARGTMKPDFEGGQLALTRRLPLLRGKLRNKSVQGKAFLVKVAALNTLAKGTTVTVESLKEHGIVSGDVRRVKVVGPGECTVALTLAVPCSASVAKAVEKAGGSAVVANG